LECAERSLNAQLTVVDDANPIGNLFNLALVASFVAIAVLSAGLLAVAACSRSRERSEGRSTTHDVSFCCCPGAFEPATITIAAGETLRFVNRDDDPHNVAIRYRGLADSVVARLKRNMPGATQNDTVAAVEAPWVKSHDQYTLSFAGVPPGDYSGYCSIHPNMRLEIRVVAR
jgi:plastocyanin